MSELGDELHRLADEGAEQARPLPPSEVIRRGDRRRHRRILSGAVATVAVAGVITAGVVVGVAGGGHPAPAPPATRPVPATAQATPQASRPATSTRVRASGAPTSAKGIIPALTTSTTAVLVSYRTTSSPVSAKARPRGRPTCPHPPTTTTSCSNCIGLPIYVAATSC